MAAPTVHPDSGPLPADLPADAVAVIYWGEDEHPPRWKLAAVVTGAPKLADALAAAGEQLPFLDGRHVRATKIGGKSSEGGRVKPKPPSKRSVSIEPEPENASA